MSKELVAAVLGDLVKLVTKHLKKGDRMRISGLGTLMVRKRAARTGRNPATGKPIQINASKTVAFRPAKNLKEAACAEGSVHLELFTDIPAAWRNPALAEKWRKVRTVRRVVTGALEIERAGKRIGSSLEAAPVVYVSNPQLYEAVADVDLAEVSITSAATLVKGDGPADAFRLDDVPGVAVEVRLAEGKKCARSWKILPSVGSEPGYPDVSPRDAQALREWEATRSSKGRLSSEVKARVIDLTVNPPGAATHWTAAAIAKAVGISETSVRRIWSTRGLKPPKTFADSKRGRPALASTR